MAATRSVSEYRPETTVKAVMTVVLDNKVAVVRVGMFVFITWRFLVLPLIHINFIDGHHLPVFVVFTDFQSN